MHAEPAQDDESAASRSIARLRLRAQHLSGPQLCTPLDVVRWMGALQAQDYGQSLWAIAARMQTPSVDAVVEAIESGEIVRTWPMRGTIHWVPAEDAAWHLSLCADRTLRNAASRHAGLGLTAQVLDRATKVFLDAIGDDRHIRRKALFEAWNAAGVTTEGQRGAHLLFILAQHRVAAIGPMDGKQQTFVRLDRFVPKPKVLSPEDALVELARRYVRSHGPATAADFAHWSALSLTTARNAVEATGFPSDTVNGRVLYSAERPEVGPSGVQLIAAYDEFLIGYRDRSDVLSAEEFQRVVPGGNGVFFPCILNDARIIGTWKRSVGRAVTVTVQPFRAGEESKDRMDEDALRDAASGYAAFHGLELKFELARV
jgi:hypothetical protein